jgi:hypothetical protein
MWCTRWRRPVLGERCAPDHPRLRAPRPPPDPHRRAVRADATFRQRWPIRTRRTAAWWCRSATARAWYRRSSCRGRRRRIARGLRSGLIRNRSWILRWAARWMTPRVHVPAQRPSILSVRIYRMGDGRVSALNVPDEGAGNGQLRGMCVGGRPQLTRGDGSNALSPGSRQSRPGGDLHCPDFSTFPSEPWIRHSSPSV